MRNLTKSIAAVSLLIPASAYSLGIGDIKLHSALNQKLDAEIALLVSAGENISDIKVRLASPDKFDEAGVPWSYFLSKIKFKAVTQADGSTVVKLSSKEALREPFLDFLLEVTWASGNLYREFTVLVDPPVSYKKPTIPVIQKPQQPASNFANKPNKPVTIINKVAAVDSQVVSGQYGPTNRMDSLWRIANKTNTYSDVSVEQMMMSIYEANPRAFYKKNVNALMAGEILKIPSKEVILKLSKRQAVVAFKKQNNVWKGRVGKKEIPTEVDNSQLTSQLELEAPATDEIANAVKVKLGHKTSAKHIVDFEIDDSKVATSDEGLALQARMDKLEQQLVMMQKILILKDEEIAALQNKTTEPIVPAQIKIKTLAEVEAEKKLAKTAPVEPIAKSVVKKPPVTVKKPIVKPLVKPKLKLKPAPVVVEEETDYFMLAVGGGSAIILAILAVLWRRKRNVEEEEEDTESMFASASEISLPDASDDELSIPVAEDSSSYNVGTVGESSFLSEFTPSDFDAFDTDESEVDPVSEADVYLAYGRYQQAEDLMVQAIKDYPERDECKLKLLEIFYSNENKSSFEEYTKELITEEKPEDIEFWDKVVEMGRELDPDSALYVAKASFESVDLEKDQQQDDNKEVEPVVVEQQEAVDEQATETDFDLSVFEDADTDISNIEGVKGIVEEQQESTLDDEHAVVDENVLDFDLSVFDLDGAAENEEKSENNTTGTETVETIEFDLDSVASSEPEEIKLEEVSDDLEIESFDFDLGEEEKDVAEEPEAINLASEADIDIDLEDFDFSSDDSKNEKEALSLENELNTEDGTGIDDFDFDFDEPVSTPTTTEPVAELDVNVTDLTDMDELETKLDLAKAYIDMGDADAAADIAKEVLEKGSEKQKQAAQEVLDQLT